MTIVVGTSTESGSVVVGEVEGATVVTVGRVVDVVVGVVVVVGSAAAAGHARVASAFSPHANRLAAFHAPSTITALADERVRSLEMGLAVGDNRVEDLRERGVDDAAA